MALANLLRKSASKYAVPQSCILANITRPRGTWPPQLNLAQITRRAASVTWPPSGPNPHHAHASLTYQPTDPRVVQRGKWAGLAAGNARRSGQVLFDGQRLPI